MPALNQQIGMQTQSFTQPWHYVMQCFRDDTIVNWSDPGLIFLCLNPLRCGGGWVGGAWGGGSTSWVRQATLKMWLQVIDWIIFCRRYLSLRHYLAQPPEEISISPPPKRLATGESRSFGGHRQMPPSLPVTFPFRHFDLLFFTHTVQWIHALRGPSVRAIR